MGVLEKLAVFLFHFDHSALRVLTLDAHQMVVQHTRIKGPPIGRYGPHRSAIGKLAEIGGRRAELARELPKTPMRRSHGRFSARKDQRQALGVRAICFDMDMRSFDDTGATSVGAAAHGSRELAE